MFFPVLAAAVLLQTGAIDKPTLHTPAELDALPVSTPVATLAYGSDPLQVGDLRLPPGKGPFPLAVVIHGGCWTKGFDTRAGIAALADSLTKRGVATWNVEYRQLGDPGGGFPGTFRDIGAAIDHVRVLARRYPLDLTRVVLVGHSAGAQAVLWAAGRPNLARDSAVYASDPFRPSGVVAIDGPGDLRVFYGGKDKEICGTPVFERMFGGPLEAKPQTYKDANPAQLLPLRTPQVFVSAGMMGPKTSAQYQAAAVAAGDRVELLRLERAGHFNMLYPGDPAEAKVETAVLRLLGASTKP